VAKVCLIRSAEGVSPGALTSTVPTLPLGLAYLAATVRSAGHEIQVIDAVGEAVDQIFERGPVHWVGLDNPEIIERVDPDCDVLGVSNMFSHNWPMIRELIRDLRVAFPNKPILVGGENATSLPEFILEESPADLCALGESEETLLELIEVYTAGKPLEQVAGIAYRNPDGEIVRTERRQRIRDIDGIPWPAWDLFNVKAYASKNFTMGLQVDDQPPSVPILATRGCPYQCTFCTSPQMWTTTYITRDPKDVVDEIAHYVETYGVRNFPFQDLTAIIKKDWILAFCNELVSRNLDIHWQLPAGTRSEAVDGEVAPLLMKSGMAHMAYAPEAGSLRIRKAVKKRVVAERFYDSVRATTAAGLHVQAFFVMGFPEEETKDLRATLKMLARLAWMGIEDTAVSHYMPYPGSEMYDRLLQEGKVDTSDRWLLAPLHTHGMRIPDEFQVNDHFSALTQSIYALAGFAVFYGVSAIRKPGYFLKMLTGLFFRPDHDVSRLQRALKGFLRTKPIFETRGDRS
jgi:anaerobic magnesium-protoporphyrin IX monomethyl ester cyclase